MPAAPVQTALVTSDVISEPIPLTGTVQPRRQTLISAETAGLVEEVLVDEGDYVRENQVIARLRQRPAEIMLQEARGELLIEKSRLDELENGSRKEDIDAEKADVMEAQANVDFWVLEEERLRQLFNDNAVSDSEYQSAKASLQRARAQLLLETAEYDRAVNGPRMEEIGSQRGEVAAREAAVDFQEDLMDRHAIRAPFSGIIGVKGVEKGQWVQTGDMVFAMAQIDVLRVQVPLPERHFSNVEIGTEALLEFPALPGDSRTAKVTAIIPLANESSRTFPVRIDFSNEEFKVAPGMFARVTLQPSKENRGASLMVPKDAIVKTPDQAEKVYVVRDGEGGLAAFPVTVSTGRTWQDRVEVFSEEIQAGNQVIIRGNETINFPGQNVRVIQDSNAGIRSTDSRKNVSSSTEY